MIPGHEVSSHDPSAVKIRVSCGMVLSVSPACDGCDGWIARAEGGGGAQSSQPTGAQLGRAPGLANHLLRHLLLATAVARSELAGPGPNSVVSHPCVKETRVVDMRGMGFAGGWDGV